MADPIASISSSKSDFEVEIKMDVPEYELLTREAVKLMARDLEQAERAEIDASNLARFRKGTRVTVSGNGKYGWVLEVRSRPNWMRVWEYGAVSVGKPMLWIPVGSMKRRASKYPVKLWRPPGKNVLINTKTRKVAYVGVPQTTIRPVLNMRAVAEEKAAHFTMYMQKALAEGAGKNA